MIGSLETENHEWLQKGVELVHIIIIFDEKVECKEFK